MILQKLTILYLTLLSKYALSVVTSCEARLAKPLSPQL